MTSPPPDQPAPGSVLADRYEILRRLGSGGMGVVYLARHRLMERLCAIKVLHPTHAGDAEALVRFTAEARNASRILHPNVCAVYDFGTAPDGAVYLAMEYVEGRTLGAIVAEQGPLPLDRAIRLLDGIAEGLDAAHALGIVHRDLKPDNVMVVTGPDREAVKLVDFGIAKALERDLDGDVTAPGTVIGTPDYMSPEQFAGDPVDARTDQYALALIFYRLITGALPFRGDTARQTAARRLTDPPRPLAESAPGTIFPDGLQAVLDRALARKPGERFASAGEFAAAVRAVVAGLPVATADQTPTVRLDAGTRRLDTPTDRTKPARRPVRWVVAAGAAALAVGGWLMTQGNDGQVGAMDSASPVVPPPVAPGPAPAPEDTATSAAAGADPIGGRPPPPPVTRPAVEREVARTAPDTAGPDPQPIPPLPTVEEIENPATRDAARRRAEQIYERTDADVVLRAMAAFTVATIQLDLQRFREAELWGERAASLNLISPAGAERDQRRRTYDNFLTVVRRHKDSTPS